MNGARSLACMSWLSFSCLTSTVEAVQPMTSITASFAATGPYTIKTAIRTNLPDGATLGISLRFLGMEASDPALGLQSHQVKVSGGKATITVDQSQATTSIPSGDYRIRVSYNPMLPENRASVLKGIKPQYPTLSGDFVWDATNRWIKSHRRDDSRLNDRTSSRKPIFTTLHARRPCAFFGQSNVIPTSTHHV